LSRITGVESTISPEAIPIALRACKRFNPDILHAHNLFFLTSMVAVLVKELTNIPLVLTLHLGRMDLLGGYAARAVTMYERFPGRLIVSRADRVVCVSKAVKRHAEEVLSVPSKKLTVVPNGVDANEFHPQAYGAEQKGKSEPKRIVVVGRIISNKGLQFLVEAAPSILSGHRVQFIIAGDGPLKPEIVRMTREAGLENFFSFLGEVPSVSELLRNCDLLVRPSLTDGMPLSVLEGMATGLPVIASRIAGTPEVITNGVNGILCPPGDARALSVAINKLLDEPSLAEGMGSRARRFVEKYHDWNSIASMNREVYTSVLRVGESADC
jgi:glycosyltransferase involved in cell wall biosynthesis